MATPGVSRVTDCSICKKKMSNPRCLPCCHTFCCHCIEDSHQKGEYKDKVVTKCPVCKSVFNLPGGKCSNFPKNVYAEELLISEQERQDLLAEKLRLDNSLGEFTRTLTELVQRSTQEKQRLESEVETLKESLTVVSSRERENAEKRREATEQLKDSQRECEKAKIEGKNWKRAAEKAEAKENKFYEGLQQSNAKIAEKFRRIEEITSGCLFVLCPGMFALLIIFSLFSRQTITNSEVTIDVYGSNVSLHAPNKDLVTQLQYERQAHQEKMLELKRACAEELQEKIQAHSIQLDIVTQTCDGGGNYHIYSFVKFFIQYASYIIITAVICFAIFAIFELLSSSSRPQRPA